MQKIKMVTLVSLILMGGCESRDLIPRIKRGVFDSCSKKQWTTRGSVFSCENKKHTCYFYRGDDFYCLKKDKL